MNWMFENHGPLAMARIAHAPKFFDDGGNAGRRFGYRPSTLRH
jgi:hypothetical protein